VTVSDRVREASAPAPPADGTIYPLREDTRLLLPFARVRAGTSFLEIGCGQGEASMIAAHAGAFVIATDRNPTALRSLRRRAQAESLPIHPVLTDLACGLGRFDRILANPPYLPVPDQGRDPNSWFDLTTDGGPDGCSTTARLFEAFPEHLRGAGSAYLLVSTLQAPERLAELFGAWKGAGRRATEVASRTLEGERLDVWELSL